MLITHDRNPVGATLPVQLVMLVCRSDDSRLSGTVRSADGDAREFSGTLELMRVFEDLVPVDPTVEPPNVAGLGQGGPASPGAR
jgi:hypothetical protein